jgi:hypothetical protein
MRITILALDTSSDGKPRVRFSSDIGEAWAYWSGDPPMSGQSFDVELSAGAPLTWGVDIVPATAEGHRLETAGQCVTLHATLESREEDGFTVLRLGPGILMVETIGDAPPTGTSVQADLRELTLTDTNI